ncbi:MAG: DNA-3-methyladenine glycosylase 2 family protein [Acidimicrobiales bacterium]|nr:DNA-3-methyladenine glycosylase 2 family protein [Acidimicrobiales bacterium]
MAGLVARHGPPAYTKRPGRTGTGSDSDGHFAALAEAVLYQQLAGAAAAAIHARVIAAVGGRMEPLAVVAAGEEALRRAGLSRAKTDAILGLAEAVTSGRVALSRMASLDDEDVIDALLGLRGIGRWTAQMFCLFRLGRLDVWPVTDYGVRKGYALAYGLPDLPAPRELEKLGDPFRPYRSVAAWYCWRAVRDRTAG